MGTLNGTFIRRSLDTQNLEKAAELIREMEMGKVASITLKDACTRFIAQAEANGNSPASVDKYRLLQREFALHFGTIDVRGITLADLDKFRLSWKMSNTTARKKIERLRAFFRFCVERNWIEKNPASGLKLPKEDHLPTLPFTAPEWEKILWACEVYPNKGIYGFDSGKRIRAFVLLLRYTGLRIGDVAALKRDRVSNGKLMVRTQKTGSVVHLPLPKIVLEALDAPAGPVERLLLLVGKRAHQELCGRLAAEPPKIVLACRHQGSPCSSVPGFLLGRALEPRRVDRDRVGPIRAFVNPNHGKTLRALGKDEAGCAGRGG